MFSESNFEEEDFSFKKNKSYNRNKINVRNWKELIEEDEQENREFQEEK